MTTEKILSSYTIAQLKKEIGKTNIKGYSKMKRAELHAIIIKNKERFSHLREQEKKKPAPKAKAKPKAKPPTNKPKPAPKPKAKKVGKVKLTKPKPAPKPKTPPKPKSPPKTMPLAAKMAIDKFTGEKMDFEKRNVKMSDVDYFTNKVKTLMRKAMKYGDGTGDFDYAEFPRFIRALIKHEVQAGADGDKLIMKEDTLGRKAMGLATRLRKFVKPPADAELYGGSVIHHLMVNHYMDWWYDRQRFFGPGRKASVLMGPEEGADSKVVRQVDKKYVDDPKNDKPGTQSYFDLLFYRNKGKDWMDMPAGILAYGPIRGFPGGAPYSQPKAPEPKKSSELDELKKKWASFPAKFTKAFQDNIKKRKFVMLGQDMSEVDYYKQIIKFMEGAVEADKEKAIEKAKKKAEKEPKKAATAKKKAEKAKKTAGAPSYTFQAASSVPLQAGDYVPKAVKPLADFDRFYGYKDNYSNFTYKLVYSFPFTNYAIPNPNYVPSNVIDVGGKYFGEPILPPPPGAQLSQPQPKYYVEDTGTYRKTILGPYDVEWIFTDYMKNKGLIYLGKAEMPTYEFYKQYTGNVQHEYKKDYKGAKQVQFFKRSRFEEKKRKPELLVWLENGNQILTRVAEFTYMRAEFSKGLTLQSVNSNPKMAEFKSWLFTLK